jgi:hypothetical protein
MAVSASFGPCGLLLSLCFPVLFESEADPGLGYLRLVAGRGAGLPVDVRYSIVGRWAGYHAYGVLLIAGGLLRPPALCEAGSRNQIIGRPRGERQVNRVAVGVAPSGEMPSNREIMQRSRRRSRVEHGFPEGIEDPAAVARLAVILRDIPAPRPPSESTSCTKTYRTYAACQRL